MNPPRILVVEDEHALSLALAAAVRQAGAASDPAPTAAQARKLLESGRRYDGMILDIGLPDENGLAFLASVPPDQRPPTVVITAHGEIQNTIAARKLGVIEFFPKPLDFDEFQATLQRLCKPRPSAGPGRGTDPDPGAFIGAARSMRAVFQQIAHSCASDDPVLVRGETGTGKSHAARLIQGHSLRSGPTGTLALGPETSPADLTTALAHNAGGVLVLEEVSLLPADVQAELVRHIEDGTGRDSPRLIATTTADLRSRVTEGSFRSDLFYRLQVLELRLPPLRERMEDLPALVSYFVGQLSPERTVEFTDRALARLASHHWPGNLRELRNTVAFALTVSAGSPVVDQDDLPSYLTSEAPPPLDGAPALLVQALDSWLDSRLAGSHPPLYRDLADSLEAVLIRRLLLRYEGKLARLATALQANRTTLRRKLQGP